MMIEMTTVPIQLSSTGQSETEQAFDPKHREYSKREGLDLFINQFIVLIRRLVLHIIHTWKSFLTVQVILPIIMIFLFTHHLNTTYNVSTKGVNLEINLNIFKSHQEPIVFLDLQDYRNVNWDLFEKKYSFVKFVNSTNITADVIQYGQESFGKYRQVLFGISRNDEENPPQYVIYYSTLVRYAGSVGIDLLSNMLINELRAKNGVNGTNVIRTRCESVTGSAKVISADKFKFPKPVFSVFVWCIFMAAMLVSGVGGCIQLPSAERVSGSRLGQYLSGANPFVVWGSKLAFHIVLYSAVLILPIMLAQAIFDTDQVFNKWDTIGALFLTFFLGMLAYLSFCYWISFYFSARATLVKGVIELCGLFLAFIQTLMTISEVGGHSITKFITDVSEVILTSHTFTVALIKICIVANKNAVCTLNMESCSSALNVLGEKEKDICCVQKSLPYRYFDPNISGAYYDLCLLTGQFLVFMTLIYLLETGICSYIAEQIKVSITKHNGRSQRVGVMVDDVTVNERNYVKKSIEKRPNEIPDAMLVSDLHKVYMKFISSVQVVNGVSFSVKKGEIFGILGVNGAGKTTTFRMIAAETFPSVGKLYSSGYLLSLKTRPKYMKTIGYCCQFAELDSFMTGEQYIRTILTLNGYRENDATNIMKVWFNVFQLQPHKHKLISQLSGGCKRRLSSLAALCVSTRVCVLDEPTAGVDVMARRSVWSALIHANHDSALIITSHSLDEMEMLCNRIAILCDGEIKAIGSPADLKASYGAGYNVILNLTQAPAHDQIVSLKTQMDKEFNCILKDQHTTMLSYRINDDIPYSILFKNLEQLKDNFPSIEDYVVLQNTLEEAFLSFSKGNETV